MVEQFRQAAKLRGLVRGNEGERVIKIFVIDTKIKYKNKLQIKLR
jgi:hypothetical protein